MLTNFLKRIEAARGRGEPRVLEEGLRFFEISAIPRFDVGGRVSTHVPAWLSPGETVLPRGARDALEFYRDRQCAS